MGSGNNNNNLTAAYNDRTAVLRIEGRGSFKASPPMKRFIHQVINTESADRILIEMSNCSGMDSTFMGVVAGIACYIKGKPAFSFKLINLSEKNKKLLVTLGVDRVVDYSLSASEEEADILNQLNGSSTPLQQGGTPMPHPIRIRTSPGPCRTPTHTHICSNQRLATPCPPEILSKVLTP